MLVVRTTTSGDTSPYLLHLLGEGGAGVPEGFDAPLAQAPFTFTVDCPSDLDCAGPEVADALPGGSPVLDYLARDYEALRTRLLDRLAALVPGWADRSAADPAVMLVELFAYLGDRLAYWQDAVAVEAYLGTARRRTSVRRHARLLGYRVHEGCAARVLLALTTDTALTLPPAPPVDRALRPASRAATCCRSRPTSWAPWWSRPCTDAELRPARNAVPLHAWGDPDHCLPAGATGAFLAAPPAPDPTWPPGTCWCWPTARPGCPARRRWATRRCGSRCG